MQEVSDNEEPVTFFQPSSPYYLTTLYVTLAALALFLCGGILFQISCYKRIRSGPDISKLIRAQHHRGREMVPGYIHTYINFIFTRIPASQTFKLKVVSSCFGPVVCCYCFVRYSFNNKLLYTFSSCIRVCKWSKLLQNSGPKST